MFEIQSSVSMNGVIINWLRNRWWSLMVICETFYLHNDKWFIHGFWEALKALQRDDGDMAQGYRPVTREKTVSLADCCALYRLKTILKAMHELLDIQSSLDKSVFVKLKEILN